MWCLCVVGITIVLVDDFRYSGGGMVSSLGTRKVALMALIIQPVNRSRLFCFNEGRVLLAQDVQRAIGLSGVNDATLKTAGRSERNYCLELGLEEPLVHEERVSELLVLVASLTRALNVPLVRRVLGPERWGAIQIAPAFREALTVHDWLLLQEA